MVWTDPATWTQDQLVKAAEMNLQLRDNLNVLKVAVDNNGKIVAISSTYFASLDGTALTGVAKLASVNTYTAKNDFGGSGGRLVVPVGADKWAT